MQDKKQQAYKAPFDPSGKLFVGLGNPGEEYEQTYHNAGSLALMSISGSSRNGFARPSRKHFSFIETSLCVLALNETFMNESGTAAREALAYFGKDPQQLVVLHDDSDMTLGTYKISYNQRSAGHHGIDSIIAQIGTSEFYRVKIGIRPKKEGARKKAEEFVLKKISSADKDIFKQTFEDIKKSLKL